MLIGTTFIDFWIIRVIITKLALFFLAASGPCRQLGYLLETKSQNSNQTQSTAFRADDRHRQYKSLAENQLPQSAFGLPILQPWETHLCRAVEGDWGDAGKWLLLGRGKREHSVLLTLKPSSFLFHLDSCDRESPFCPTPPSPGKEGQWSHSQEQLLWRLSQLHGYRRALLETRPAGVCSCDTTASLTWIIGLSRSKPPWISIAPCRVCFCSVSDRNPFRAA